MNFLALSQKQSALASPKNKLHTIMILRNFEVFQKINFLFKNLSGKYVFLFIVKKFVPPSEIQNIYLANFLSV